MCWINKTIEKKIADKDIICYKVVFETLKHIKSLYQNFLYTVNKIYPNIELTPIKVYDNYRIFEGYHSYLYAPFIYNNTLWSQWDDTIIRYTSFMSFTNSRLRLATCIIPKGSIYYTNSYNEIVSSSILIKEITDLPKREELVAFKNVEDIVVYIKAYIEDAGLFKLCNVKEYVNIGSCCNLIDLNVIKNNGFRSYLSIAEASKFKQDDQVILKCIIPAGSLYYKNFLGQLLSNSIKICGVVKE